MKKVLLTCIGLIPALAMAQGIGEPGLGSVRNVTPSDRPVATPAQQHPVAPVLRQGIGQAKAAGTYTYKTLGTTTYDLQNSGGSINRIVNQGGNLAVTWTVASDFDNQFASRGSAYAYFNGTTWTSPTNSRIEPFRRGWPTIGFFNNGTNWIISHDVEGGFNVLSNSAAGGTSFTASPRGLNDVPRSRPIWNRAVSVNDTIHMMTVMTDTGLNATKPVINGVKNPLIYNVTYDKGQTWAKSYETLPGYDSIRYKANGDHDIAMDVNGRTIAIVLGGFLNDVALWKSTDNGSTWTKTIVDSFPKAPADRLPDTSITECNDGNLEVLIDNNGKVHVWFGLVPVQDVDLSDAGFSYFPFSNEICYWNEDRDADDFVVLTDLYDDDGNGQRDVKRVNLITQPEPDRNIFTAAGYGTGILTHISACVDATNNIYLVYSSVNENDISINDEYFRDIYVVYSTDGGMSWMTRQNVTNNLQSEEVFPFVLRHSPDANMHLVFQQDDVPGTYVLNNSTQLNNQSPSANLIIYTAIPFSEILSGNATGGGFPSGINQISAENFNVSEAYPNPFGGSTMISVNLKADANLSYTVTDISGKVLESNQIAAQAGSYHIEIGNGLPAGIYLVNINDGNQVISRKISKF